MSYLEVLYGLIITILVVISILWAVIIKVIIKRNVKEKKSQAFEKILIEGFVSSYDKTNQEITNIKLEKLKKAIKRDPQVFRESAEIFVKVNRVVKFSKNSDFKKIFKYLDIDKILNKKFTNKDWYVKSRAIWLSYEFELEENLPAIAQLRDHTNVAIRREAQIALTAFLDWRSLAFFPYVTKPISLWQQIRIIEKLQETEKELDIFYFEKALKSENKIII